MRQWPGMEENKTAVGSGFTSIENVSYAVDGEMRRRPVLANRKAVGGPWTRLSYVESASSNYPNLPSPVLISVGAALTGGSVTTGTHKLRARFRSTISGMYGPPSVEYTFAVVANAIWDVTSEAFPPYVDRLMLEITLAGGSTYYAAGEASITRITSSASDATLTSNGVAYSGPVNASTALLPAGNWLIGSTSTTVSSYNLNTFATQNVLTGLTNSTYGPTFAFCSNKLYLQNGVDGMQVVNSGNATGYSAGIPAPAIAPTVTATGSGYVTAGTHLVRYRYYDSVRQRYSNPSPAASITAGTSQTLSAVCVASTTTSVDTILLEVTLASGSEYFRATVGPNSTAAIVVSINDNTLSVQLAANSYAGPDGFGHEVPPVCRLVAECRGRTFSWGPTQGTVPDMLYWSRVDFPESYKANEWARRGLNGTFDSPSAIFAFQDDLYLCGRQSMRRLVYTYDPANGMLVPIPTDLGAFNQQCIVRVDSAVYGFGRTGVWRLAGISPQRISQPIDPFWRADADFAQSSLFFADYDPTDRCVTFYYARLGDTGVRGAISFDIDGQRWFIKRFRNVLNAAALVSTAATNATAYIADGDGGYVWNWQQAGIADCVPTGSTSTAMTTTAGSTTTVIQLTASPGDCLGAIAYFPATGEERRITVSAGSTVTLASALATAPAAGVAVYIGSVRTRFLSDRNTLSGDKVTRGRPNYLMLEQVNETTAPEVAVQYYTDSSTTPAAITSPVGGTNPNGVTSISGNTIYADLSPVVVAVPVLSSYNRFIQFSLVQEKPAGTLQLLDASFSESADSNLKERSQA
jgi:hypothetical protein